MEDLFDQDGRSDRRGFQDVLDRISARYARRSSWRWHDATVAAHFNTRRAYRQ